MCVQIDHKKGKSKLIHKQAEKYAAKDENYPIKNNNNNHHHHKTNHQSIENPSEINRKLPESL